MFKVAFLLETDREVSIVEVDTVESEGMTPGNKVSYALVTLDVALLLFAVNLILLLLC